MLELLRQRGIRSGRVLSAMARVPRERFVPESVRHLAYADRALPIGSEQTISQPFIVALMTEALALEGTESVLEVGTGSGYQAAILGELADRVVSIERHQELSARAKRVLDELGYANVTCIVGDGTQGWLDGAPYDRILVAAAAAHVPPALEEQLADRGILVIPVGSPEGQVLQAYRKSGGKLHAEPLSGCRFVPLVGAQD
ncbi:MAG: protein-L-isoaspartate(D-aspartate) O-methyltransferase [Planctomycetota bacterium]|nr:MAG: protein-L-isoaspartate(D-aspartate) O-methyltransferase [Planctomycetota bacterium]